jgi:hypothetical protein
MENKKTFKSMVITTSVTLSSIITHIIHSIFSFIAIYFFKPLWDRALKWWNDRYK